MLPTHRRFASPQPLSDSSLSSDVRQSWKFMTILLGVQLLVTLFVNLNGNVPPHEATNTELLYNPSISLFLTIFFAFETTPIIGILLPIYNTFLIAGLMGWPHTWNIKISLKDLLIHAVSISGIIAMRMLLGYLFGRGTGFAYPMLFFNDAIHETTLGLSVATLYCITQRIYGDPAPDTQHKQLSPLTLFLLWTPNALHGPIFFWSFSVTSITGIQSLLSLLLQRRESTPRSSRTHSGKTLSRWSRFLKSLRIFFVLTTIFIIISYLHHVAYLVGHAAHSEKVTTLPEAVLAQFLLLSYPRRNDSTILSSTLQSYTHGVSSRFLLSVYTTVEPVSHPAFSDAQSNFRAVSGLNFFPDPDPVPLKLSRPVRPGYLPGKQTFDLYSALSWAERNVKDNNTRYIGIMEDDFEWCNDGWDELKALMYEVSLRESSDRPKDQFCGIFVATGGSGLLVRPSTIPMLQSALQRYAFDLNPDIILQDCLRGELPECAGCKLAASRRLLFRHTGASRSTYRGRLYPEDRWQCGWRQPFNGKLGVWVP